MNDEILEVLYHKALEAREKAYVPYSKFKVGAALLTKSGSVYAACNVENASYGLSLCAERNAIFKAISEGEDKFELLVVVADTKRPVSPCGACRQVLSEFGIYKVVLANLKKEYKYTNTEELLPYGFTECDLNGRE